jgi:hypothetical protein
MYSLSQVNSLAAIGTSTAVGFSILMIALTASRT